ncbi:MAG: major capsid protein [Pirellula sp.]
MPDTNLTLADVVRINDVSVRDMGATDIFNDAPLLSALFATTASNGTIHSYLRESTAPIVGFRAPNVGIDVTASTDVRVDLNLSYLDARYTMDKQLADTGKGRDYHLERGSKRNLRQAFFIAENQIINGGTVNGAAFNGFQQALNALANPMVVNAAGAAARSSVYAIRCTPDEANVAVIMGNDGDIKIEPYFEHTVVDGSNRTFIAYSVPISGWIGLQVGATRSIARLANIPATGTGSVTDALLQSLFDLFPASAPPTHFVMNRRSRGQLQSSRSTVNIGGNSRLLTRHAETPVDFNGIPIVCVESIGNAETAVA